MQAKNTLTVPIRDNAKISATISYAKYLASRAYTGIKAVMLGAFPIFLLTFLLAPTPSRANLVVHFCQEGNTEIGVLVSRGDSGWITGGLKGITGFHKVKPNDCYRDRINTYRSSEYVFAATTSSGRVVPLVLNFDMRSRGRDEGLRTGQICVPEDLQHLDGSSIRSNAQVMPCRSGEVSWASSLFVLAGEVFENATFTMSISQDEIDAMATDVGEAEPSEGDANANSAADPPPDIECDWSCRLMSAAIQKNLNAAATKKAPDRPRSNNIDVIRNALLIQEHTAGPVSGGNTDLLSIGWVDVDAALVDLMPDKAIQERAPTGHTKYRATRFGFMPDSNYLIEVTDLSWGNVGVFFVFDSETENSWWLNNSLAFYDYLRVHPPIVTTEQQALHLFWAYMFFIRAGDNSEMFALVETIDDRLFPKGLFSEHPDLIALIREDLQVARCAQNASKWRCNGSIYFQNSIFEATVEFQPGKAPEMLSDRILYQDLPVSVQSMPLR